MATYTDKRILIIFTGGTVAGNVAKSKVLQNVKSDPNSFMTVLDSTVNLITSPRNSWLFV